MRSQPRVDAVDVESVAALRQDSDFLAGGELGEANGALGQLLVGAVVAVGHARERFQDLLF